MSPVYVDDVFIPAAVPNGARTVTSRWCHLTADTTEELDALATSIGLRTAWRQSTGTVTEHYDVTASRRAAAVRAGAIEITWREGAALTSRKVALRDGEPVEGATFKEQLDATRARAADEGDLVARALAEAD